MTAIEKRVEAVETKADIQFEALTKKIDALTKNDEALSKKIDALTKNDEALSKKIDALTALSKKRRFWRPWPQLAVVKNTVLLGGGLCVWDLQKQGLEQQVLF